MTDRRSFLRLFGLAAAAHAVPLPSIDQIFETAQGEEEFAAVSLDEINELTARYILPGLIDNYFKSDPILAYLKRQHK